MFYIPDKSSNDHYHLEHQIHMFTSNIASDEQTFTPIEKCLNEFLRIFSFVKFIDTHSGDS